MRIINAHPPCTRPARIKSRARNLHKQVNYQLDAAGNLTSGGLRSFDHDKWGQINFIVIR